ncbi:DUF2442 domain-containing protein [Duganella qianjiadongensis]|uniref:DUF2442 domain-containing protein n=1 Tax=Duganella qianjiadongensis TaxID=2692176 RepID=A0ABW9VGC5_9BURK|nr:DUF2442 domain-containing protein [Duganella qianjiadongensis]MYM38669.1 DUF2442 domain-containing protein [Duganella qianjiadongensis]
MDITDATFEAANRRGAAKKTAFPAAVAVRYDRRISRIVITLASGLQIAFAPRDAQGLENAHPANLIDAEISPSGLGVHFPKLDADLYIPALLEGFLGSKRWMASQMGKVGGKVSSAAKTAASRENGKLGGRPKKVKGPVAA